MKPAPPVTRINLWSADQDQCEGERLVTQRRSGWVFAPAVLTSAAVCQS
jgi:hypothetical protein